MKKIKIVLNPGHGGYYYGGINNKLNIKEKDITLKLAKYLKEYLEQYENIEVILTREDDIPEDYELELEERAMIARRSNATIYINLHFNWSKEGKKNGAEVFVTANKSLEKYNKNTSELARKILNNLSKLGIENKGVLTRICKEEGKEWMYSDGTKADYYADIRYPMKGIKKDLGVKIEKGYGIPSILIEHCYINGIDEQFINSGEKIRKIAIQDGKAIVEYYNLKKKGDK